MSKMSEIHADEARATWLRQQAARAHDANLAKGASPIVFDLINTKVPLAVRLLTVSNGLSLRVDTLRKVRGKT